MTCQKNLDASGSTDRKHGSGRRRTVRTAENVGVVEEMFTSQETAPGSHRTVYQIDREVGISKTTVQIIRQNLKLKCFRKISK